MDTLEKLRKAVARLTRDRDDLDDITNIRIYINSKTIISALDKVNLDEVTLDNFKPENSKCLLSQDELKNIRKELRETIDTIVYDISELKCLTEKLEDMYKKVNMSCID